MSEPRKNHLSIDGGQVKEDEHVSSYKAIPETDTEFRSSKTSLAKSKEKISPDGAEEKLLPKEVEAKIVTRVDMADAKYVVEDHRNGDAKIELDANKRQFSGLSKEELLKYADDPFWVNLRWFMFILFWAMWVCMLAGAITIIIKAPKCAPPTPKTWFEEGPLVEMDTASYEDIIKELPSLQTSKVQGIFVDVPTFQSDEPTAVEQFKQFATKAKEHGIKVIVDLIVNYVPTTHDWFVKSEKREAPYSDFFLWANGKDYSNGTQNPPSNWRSTLNAPAWSKSATREQFYLHQFEESQADLNFNNEAVRKEVDAVINRWMKAGAAGVRLNKARLLQANSKLDFNGTIPDDTLAVGRGSELASGHEDYAFWQHKHTSDLPELDALFKRWAGVVIAASETPGEGVFTLSEEGRPELFVVRNLTSLRPPMSAPIDVSGDVSSLVKLINTRLGSWPAIQLKSTTDSEVEIASFALLLPAAPVFDLHQIEANDNDTSLLKTDQLYHLTSLRSDASIQHGHYSLVEVPAHNQTRGSMLACARWKAGHTGYVAVLNPGEEEGRANLTLVTSLPSTLSVHHMSQAVRLYTNYTISYSLAVDDVLVPPKSTLVLSYVPKTAVEN